ncbi:MAG: biotin--[acetyl-CoA-carboxylase] ligase [Candidatus Zixiibacteriota bacterium]
MRKTLPQVAQELLKVLKKDRRRFYSTRELATYFDLSPYAVHQAVDELRNWGYDIEDKKKGSYRLKNLPDLLLPHEIKENLGTSILGKEIHSFKVLRSTNELGFRLAQNRAPEGTLIVSEHQTRGRGRLGRNWFSPAEVGLWMSLILKPDIPPSKAPGISLCAGLALVLAINEMTGLKAKIKWPNDCVVNGGKIAGILLELSAELDKIDFIILGVGVNVNQNKEDFPKNLIKKATSLKMECGEEISRLKLIKLFLKKFEKIYLEFKKNGLTRLMPEIKMLSALLGKKVKARLGKMILRGRAKDIDENGSLIIVTRGKEKAISAGEITLL